MTEATTRGRLLRACYSFLIPVARFLLRSGISFREFSEISRMAFVEVAGQDYGIRGRPTNTSRVSAMTGIGRKEVRRLRHLRAKYIDDPRIELSPLSDVLNHWYTKPLYQSHGKPRVLAFKGGPRSFVGLVKECAGDLPAGAIKVELIRCGAVVEPKPGYLRAERRYVIPENVDEKLIAALTFNLRALASTIAFNCNPARTVETRVERFIQSQPLSDGATANIRTVIRKQLDSFTDELDDFLSEQPKDSLPDSKRIGVGLFYYED